MDSAAYRTSYVSWTPPPDSPQPTRKYLHPDHVATDKGKLRSSLAGCAVCRIHVRKSAECADPRKSSLQGLTNKCCKIGTRVKTTQDKRMRWWDEEGIVNRLKSARIYYQLLKLNLKIASNLSKNNWDICSARAWKIRIIMNVRIASRKRWKAKEQRYVNFSKYWKKGCLPLREQTLYVMEATSMIMGHNLMQFEARNETQARIRGRNKCRPTPFLYDASTLLRWDRIDCLWVKLGDEVVEV
jgi:hypothetical protein